MEYGYAGHYICGLHYQCLDQPLLLHQHFQFLSSALILFCFSIHTYLITYLSDTLLTWP